MKNFIQAMILTMVMIALVSYIDYRPEERANGGGSGMKRKGDSGLIIPGSGELMAEVSFEPMQAEKRENEPPEKTESSQAIKQATSDKTIEETQVTSEEITEELKEEHNKVNGMIIAFWHGVAAVLIGEASALLVAFVWMKIRGASDV